MPSQVPDGVSWSEIPDFDSADRTFYCSTSGQGKRIGESVYRGAHIDLEGFYTICLDSAKQLADLIGWVEPSQVDAAVALTIEVQDELAEVKAHNEQLQTALDALIVLVAEDEDEDEEEEPIEVRFDGGFFGEPM